jgi:phosphoribosylaminoimidazole-succinocarboxamide synthase
MAALFETQFRLPGQSAFYRGKVRDVYFVNDYLIMVASDRISAFDHVLPKPIPYKGQVLNQTATYFLQKTADIVPNWLVSVPDAHVAIGRRCQPLRVEMVIRGYLAGHAARVYNSGLRTLCGVVLPDGLREGDKLTEPVITPTTKAEAGHDQDISREEIISRGLVDADVYEQIESYTRALYARGSEMAQERGLLLVDTKYEFGLYNGTVMLMDEIHTPDSSRYYFEEGYHERQQQGVGQPQLSKEFVREWLMAHGFQGLEGQVMPVMPDDFVSEVTSRYIQLYETITGQTFVPTDYHNIEIRIEQKILEALSTL